MFGEDDIVRSHRTRVLAIGNIVLVAFGFLVARLWYLQVYKGSVLHDYSLKNRLRKEIVKAPRGMIFSRNNQLLVDNVPRFDAVITPQYLKDKKKTLARLSKILDMPVKQIEKIIRKKRRVAKYKSIIVKKNISRKEVAIIETENSKVPGVSVETFISREYLDSEIGGHLLGYISEINTKQLPKYRKRDKINYKLGDFIGQFGLEEQMDLTLRGQDGYEFVEVDALGRKKRHISLDNFFKGIENAPAAPGKNVRLTIDRDMQKAAFDALEGKVGSAVAIDINTGEILTMVSRPSFDPSYFSRGITSDYWSSLVNNENNPLRDRTIQEHYPPGSTFKAITAIAGMEEGIIDERTEVHCSGKFRLGRRIYHCWKKYGHGKVRLTKALRESCNVYFYKLATKLDIDVLGKYARGLGLGTKTEIKLPREVSGLIPSKDWKKKQLNEEWQLGETLSCVIGQSYVLATPLQLALSYATMANGGKLYQPYLVKEVFNNSGEIIQKFDPLVKAEIEISQQTLDAVKKGLYEVVNVRKGTAWWHRGRGIDMAGKTGTSQVMRHSVDKLYAKCEELPMNERRHGLFVGFAPASNPQVAVASVIEHGCHGSSAAAPVVKTITEAYMKKYMPEESKVIAERQRKEYLRILKKQKAEKAAKEKKQAETT